MAAYSIAGLARKPREFADERDWGQLHSPKNLAMALSVEVAEILEHLQWLTEEQSRRLNERTLAAIKEEIGDVLIYLVRFVSQLGIDPVLAAEKELDTNRRKYPTERVKGKSLKYTEYNK